MRGNYPLSCQEAILDHPQIVCPAYALQGVLAHKETPTPIGPA